MNRKLQSINPKNGKIISEYGIDSQEEIESKLERANSAYKKWRGVPISKRQELLLKVANVLRERKSEFAELINSEMGKILSEGKAEIEKCAIACEYYAENSEGFLADKIIETNVGKSFVTYQSIGVVLAIMPWNFPFWQVIRFAAPNLMAGNVGVLKHASNVSGCALAIEEIFEQAGFPKGCFTSLLVEGKNTDKVIENDYVKAVTLTGSTPAGKAVAAKAGECLKKTVLELGGSDPYVVLADADIDLAVKICAKSRLINAGQSCIAAKRFIVASEVIEEFTEKFKAHMEETEIAPMAREDLRDELHEQVEKSIAAGAELLIGGEKGEGAYYAPTVLVNVKPGMVAFDEELFGPVAAIIEAKSEDEAFELANKTVFGLGSAIFSKDEKRAEELAKTNIDAGACFVNSMVVSDPRLPFGGVKESGYGRELGLEALREFVNIKTISIS